LIAKLAKKDPEFARTLKSEFELNVNVKRIGERKLAQLIMNLDFNKMSI
jgi:hypothetical protein